MVLQYDWLAPSAVRGAAGADGMVRMYSATSLASPCSWALTAQFQATEAQQGVAQLCWRPQGAAALATLAVMAGSSIGIWEYDPGELLVCGAGTGVL